MDMKSLIEKMDSLEDLFRSKKDKPESSSCGMCGANHGLDEECAMDEDAQDFADTDKAERIAMLKRRIARAKIEARSGGNPHAKKRLRDFQEELRQLMGAVEEGFEDATTEPDPEYSDTHYMTKDLSGGINRRKKSYPKVAGGDNPMAVEDDEMLESRIKAELTALYKI